MRIVVMPGDGIGPEITEASVAVLSAVGRHLDLGLRLEHHAVGETSFKAEGTTLPARVFEAARDADAFMLGPLSHAGYPDRAQGGLNPSAEFRTRLDLYANIRPSRSRANVAHWGRTPMDLVIVRENTEGFYADRNMHLGSGEFMPTPDLALSVRKISAQGSRRIAVAAFELARQRRRKVTAVHKANVLKVSEALFLREVRAVAIAFPDVDYSEQLIDSMTALLVRDAQRFDVVVTTNMFGDILSDLAAELSGSLGLAGSINVGDAHCMAQAQHGSAPDIAGVGRANPVSLVLSVAMMLDWLGTRHRRQALNEAARRIEAGVDALLPDPQRRTQDLGGPLGTAAFAEALVAEIERRL